MSLRYVLGIDAGGTSTEAVVADEFGRVLGRGSSRAGNADGVGADVARRSFLEAVAGARAAAGDVTFSAVFAGVAGVITQRDRDVTAGLVTPALRESPSIVAINHDCRIALAGGLAGRPGVALIAGTGSSCYGRGPAGREWLAGGWGSVFGDEGSSYWIAVEGVRAALRDADGRGEPTILGSKLFPLVGVTTPSDLLGRMVRGELNRTQIAALAPAVTDAAAGGDTVARDIVGRAVDELALAVKATASAVGFAQRFEVVTIGGLFRSGYVATGLHDRLSQALPGASVVEPVLTPASGAALLAIAGLNGVDPAGLPAGIVSSLRDGG